MITKLINFFAAPIPLLNHCQRSLVRSDHKLTARIRGAARARYPRTPTQKKSATCRTLIPPVCVDIIVVCIYNVHHAQLRKKSQLANLSHLSESQMKEILQLQERLDLLNARDACRDSFMEYIRHIWPGFIEGDHHRLIADKLTRVAKGELKRLIVNMPPRHTKSEFASIYFPSWMMGLKPDLKIMQTTHTADLSINFGRKVRNLMDTDEYKGIFPEASLAADSKSAGKWQTGGGGEYFAAGVGGAIAGRGADLLIIDDPHSEQDAMSLPLLDSCYEWYTSGPRQRLQPGGTIVIVMTRWSTADLTGRLLSRQTENNADQWEVVELPAVFEDSGNVLWPEFWKREELDAVKASIPVSKWNAQYQQNPTSEEGAIIKREWWNLWEKDDPPPCSYIIQSYDTAFSKKETADYSAITTWGVFSPSDGAGEAIILLDAQKGRWDFPELKAVAQEQYNEFEPDMVLIEAQASGTPLTHELRAMGIPVVNYRPSRG